MFTTDPHAMIIMGYAGLAIVALVFVALTLQPAVDALPKRRPVPPAAEDVPPKWERRSVDDEHATQPGAADAGNVIPLSDWKPGQSWTRSGAYLAAHARRKPDHDA